MPVREDKGQAEFLNTSQRGDNDDDVLSRSFGYAAVASHDVVHHWREGREIKGYVIAEPTERRNRHILCTPSINKFWVPNADKVRVRCPRIRAVQPILENPRKIVPMSNTEDLRFLRPQSSRHS